MTYEPDCTTDSRVYVNGTRLPAGEVDVWIRNEGPVSTTRYCEAEFASPFEGEDFLDAFDTIDEDQSNWDTLRVEILPDRPGVSREDEEYLTVFYGLVTGVGNGPGNERMWQCRGRGIGQFLDKIPASQSFGTAQIDDVLAYIHETIESKFPLDIVNGLGTTADGPGELFEQFPALFQNALSAWNLITTGTASIPINTKKTFSANKHTLDDVIQWFSDKMNRRVWFEPRGEQLYMFAAEGGNVQSHHAHYLDGAVRVVNNDALAELAPVNTLVLNGKATRSIRELGEFELSDSLLENKYYQARARHQTLYEAQGENEYVAGPVVSSESESIKEVIREAESLLKQRILEATGGDAQALLAPQVLPFDVLTAKPTCDGSPATDTPAIDYQATRVHHKIRPASVSSTTMNLGLKATEENIVVTGGWKDA